MAKAVFWKELMLCKALALYLWAGLEWRMLQEERRIQALLLNVHREGEVGQLMCILLLHLLSSQFPCDMSVHKNV